MKSSPSPPERISLALPPVKVSFPAFALRVTLPLKADASIVLAPSPPVKDALSILIKVSVPVATLSS
jgi:hypothetical protein